MKIAVIYFPGSNCERETALALRRANMEPVEFLWNQDISLLNEFAGFVIVGGFSYEDRSRAGIIAALDPLMQALSSECELGKPILGICNGAQILVESGLVPGLKGNRVGLALTENKRIQNGKVLGTGFYNEWVNIKLCKNFQRNVFTRHLTSESIIHLPVAHGEGRFVVSDVLWEEIAMQGLGLFQYCDAAGKIIDEFPVNPNGSYANLAAISNKRGNVLAIMPHPERTIAGDPLFRSMHDYIAEGFHQNTQPLNYLPRFVTPLKNNYHPKDQEYLIASIVTDNEALTVESTLKQLGFEVAVKRFVHWEMNVSQKDQTALIESGILYNPRKEYLVNNQFTKNSHTFRFLVRAKENMKGIETLQLLKDQYALTVDDVKHGILWEIQVFSDNARDICDTILTTHILHNPYAHDCYSYVTE